MASLHMHLDGVHEVSASTSPTNASYNSQSRIIDDLIPLILRHLNSHSQTVAAVALVSSRWLDHARSTLYYASKLQTFHACYLLARSLNEHPELGQKIQHLRLQPVLKACTAGIGCRCRNFSANVHFSPLFRLSKLQSISLSHDCARHADACFSSRGGSCPR